MSFRELKTMALLCNEKNHFVELLNNSLFLQKERLGTITSCRDYDCVPYLYLTK